jgi:lipopolysaccharide/colanic/teichoic acid biosynthesis glycosyltransferase
MAEGIFPFKKKTVLVFGVSWSADIFLRTVREAGGQHISVAGVICPQSAHRGRLFHSYPVLGTPEELPNILRELNTHGVAVDEIVITTPFEKLSPDIRSALVYVEASTNIKIEHFGDNIKFIHNESQKKVRALSVDATKPGRLRLSLQDMGTSSILGRSFWKFKRAFDIILALVLIVFTAPLFFVVILVVFLDVGCPILFWQQRPGRFGRNFKVYKFRTMKSAYDSEGRHIPDNERTSAIGRFIRHTRLDELPQLFHILFGQMSFIGPRPLLPIDQDDEHSARLAVRPGLTGWAQVNGGREVSIADKAAMDIWYVHNASFALDIKIAISTVYTIVFGERPNPNAIREAWLYLRNATISEVAAGPVDGPPETERWVA